MIHMHSSSETNFRAVFNTAKRLCGKESFQLHILGLQAPSFGLRHGRKCEICPTLTLSFLTRPRAAHEAKPGSERGIQEGLKGSCGPPSRTRTRPPSHGASWRHRRLSHVSSRQLFVFSRSTPDFSYQNGRVNICPAHTGETQWCNAQAWIWISAQARDSWILDFSFHALKLTVAFAWFHVKWSKYKFAK